MDEKKHNQRQRISRIHERAVQWLVRRWAKRFYWYLAVAVSLLALVDLTQTRFVGGVMLLREHCGMNAQSRELE